MALPLLAMLGIGAGMGIAQGITNNIGASSNQRKADRNNIKFWKMQNQYNDPVEQMTRLKKAGLNPNLIYGQSVAGATGNSGSAPAPSKAAPFSIDAAGGAMNALQAHQAEANVENTNVRTLREMEKLGVDKQYLQPMAKAELDKMTLGNIKQYLDNQQLAPFARTAIERAAIDLKQKKATLSGKYSSNEVASFQAKLARQNINPSGNFAITLLRMLIGHATDNSTNSGQYDPKIEHDNQPKY